MHHQANYTNIEAGPESGNVLIYILIGIVLLAALNFAFSQGSDSGSDSTLDKGEAVIAASDIIRYAGTVEQTVRDLQRREGCSENELSFHHASGDNYNYSAPITCKAFHFEGGGLSYDAPKSKWMVDIPKEWYFPDDVCVEDVGTSSGSCSPGNEDLVIMLPNLDLQICQQINSKLNISSVPSITTWSGDFTSRYYTGSFTNNSRKIGDGMTGKRSGCFNDGSGNNHYYYVLIAR